MDDETSSQDKLSQQDWDEHTVEGSISDLALPTPQDRTEAYLIVIAGSHVGEMVKVDQQIVIGRGRAAGLRVKDASVSKEHVQLSVDSSGAVIAEDLGSRNGTFINGERIGTHALKDGDKIYVGTTTILKFSLADSLEESFQQHMYQAAIRDPLTGLYNRRHMTERVESEVSYASRHGIPLSVMMLDIDHFKRINDDYGHAAGDTVLVGVASRMTEAIRKEDFAARFGGEEFIIVCRGTQAKIAQTVAERVRQVVESNRFVPDHPDHVVTLSVGVAGMPDPDVRSATQLIESADRALYRAKREGRNRVCRFDVGLDGTKPTGTTESVTSGE